ncbi:hypothetical protein [Lewinella cohaerens]|uniref:hypothetical protein n=1 Tax=Lewinella cohaerens TaxID=70995 RepID=UPI0003685425|nr:hypothetical protein [Lewinella cohaerens]
MESVFINFIKKASFLGVVALLIFTFLVLGRDSIGKDIIPQLSEDNALIVIKWIVSGFFLLIIFAILIAFVSKIIKPEEKKSKPEKLKEKTSSVWKYILVFLLGVGISFFIIKEFAYKEKGDVFKYYVTDFSNVSSEIWDTRSTSRVSFSNHIDFVKLTSKGPGRYQRHLMLGSILTPEIKEISTGVLGKEISENGFWGFSFIVGSGDEYFLLIRSNQSYLGFIQEDDKLVDLINWSENFNLKKELNTISLQSSGSDISLMINNVSFARLERERIVKNISYVLCKASIEIHDLYVN